MKKTLLLLFTLAALETAKAQIAPEKLLGTWTLIKYDYGNGNIGDQTKAKFKRLRSFTPHYFTELEFDAQGINVKNTLWGPYSLNFTCCVGPYNTVPDSSILYLHITNTSESATVKQKTSANYNVKLDSDDLLHVTGEFDGVKVTELWMHVKERPSQPGNYDPKVPWTAEKLDTRSLLILKTNDGEFKLKRTAEHFKPFDFLKPGEFSAIEVIGDEEAIQKYGMDGRFGVVSVRPRPANMKAVVEQLKKQKNLD